MRTIKTKSAVEEFMRLFYVALTRARNMLFVTATGNVSRGNSQFGEKKVNGPLSMLQWLNNVSPSIPDSLEILPKSTVLSTASIYFDTLEL